jgi:hypothetical protein
MPTKPTSLPEPTRLPLVQQFVSVLWPSFITASMATILFFTVFDPVEMALISGFPEITRLAGYTIGFFAFWLLTSVSSGLTCYFRRPCTPRIDDESRNSPE